jgi:hypothetical protein
MELSKQASSSNSIAAASNLAASRDEMVVD